MDVPLSNEDIHQALKSENGFRGVYSYDLLPNLRRGQFCVVNTVDNFYQYGIERREDTIG